VNNKGKNKEEEPIFGEPTCMIYGAICDIVEYINTPIEMWCYCKKYEYTNINNQIRKTFQSIGRI
jgi:hypothetical protein